MIHVATMSHGDAAAICKSLKMNEIILGYVRHEKGDKLPPLVKQLIEISMIFCGLGA
jgi:hypothetical protein